MGFHKLFLNLLLMCSTALILGACGEQTTPPPPLPTATAAQEAAATPKPTTLPEATAPPAAESQYNMQAGQHLYAEACTPCHGQDATGIEGIGLDLTTSNFVGALNVTQLAQLIIAGRTINSAFSITGINMPPKGGRTDLSDEDMLNIAAYLHSLNTQAGAQSERAALWLETGDEAAESKNKASGKNLSENQLAGQTTYLRYCAVCHGSQGEGIESLGKSLTGNEFTAPLDDDGLAEFIKVGRAANDKLNSTGIEMLPYGGQAPFSVQKMDNLIAFLRTLDSNQEAVAAKHSDVADEPEDDVEIGSAVPEISAEEFESLKKEAFSIMLRARPKCFTCHHIIERGNKSGPGPYLDNLGTVAAGRVPGISAKEYIRQAITHPSEFIVEECPSGPCVNAMPPYNESLNEEKLETLVSFFLVLK